jgi:hypothetical protein
VGIDAEVILKMKVASTGRNRTGSVVYLNSESDYHSPDNFTVVLARPVLEKWGAAEDAQEFFCGKTIRVRGTVTLYNGRLQVVVVEPPQVESEVP